MNALRNARYLNIDPMCGSLIAGRLATLHELKTIYSFEDAFLMWEADFVPKFNEYRAQKAALERH